MRREDHLSVRALGQCGVRVSRRCLWASLVAALVAWSSTLAQAGFINGSFKIDIAESGLRRGTGTDLLRRFHKNEPVPDDSWIGPKFCIGDFDHDPFAWMLTILSNHSHPGIPPGSSYGTVSDVDSTEDRSKLVLDIGGLTPGESLISALFPAGEGSDLMTTATSPIAFDFGFEEILTTVGLFEGYHSLASWLKFFTRGCTEIPEPSSVMLLLAGLAGLSRIRRFRCR